MKILHINTKDIRGGAGIAAYRLHTGLVEAGADSRMLVQEKFSDDHRVIGPKTKSGKLLASIKHEIEKIPFRFMNTNEVGSWTSNLFPSALNKHISRENPDIVHLHLITNSMMSIYEMRKIKKPLVWTMHDMWPFAGGFHYSEKYLDTDGSLISYIILQAKRKHWKKLKLYLVSPSSWLADLAKESALFRGKHIDIIRNPIDVDLFRYHDKYDAKKIFGFQDDEKLILFGAVHATTDKRKGFDYLSSTFKELASRERERKIRLVVFGASKPQKEPNLQFPTTYLGKIYDQVTMSLLYSAADVTVVPSILDNYPNVILESLACGTPVAAFKVGGIPEMVQHKENGYLAEPFSPKELCDGIIWCLNEFESKIPKLLSDHSLLFIANRYLDFYNRVLKY